MNVTPDMAAAIMADAAIYHGVRRLPVKNAAFPAFRLEIRAKTNRSKMYPKTVMMTATGDMTIFGENDAKIRKIERRSKRLPILAIFAIGKTNRSICLILPSKAVR